MTCKPTTLALSTVVFSLGVASTLIAQSLAPLPQRLELQRSDLSGAPGMEVIASITEYSPGDVLTQHFHHGIEAGFVIQGAAIRLPDGSSGALATGANLLNLRGAKHGGFTITGDKTLKLYTVHIVDKGKPLYDSPK